MEKPIVTAEYRQSLPDTQNRDASEILGANVPIMQVGISNFRIPLRFMSATGEPLPLEASVVGTVSLAADRKGINMSRISNYNSFNPTLPILRRVLTMLKCLPGSIDRR